MPIVSANGLLFCCVVTKGLDCCVVDDPRLPKILDIVTIVCSRRKRVDGREGHETRVENKSTQILLDHSKFIERQETSKHKCYYEVDTRCANCIP